MPEQIEGVISPENLDPFETYKMNLKEVLSEYGYSEDVLKAILARNALPFLELGDYHGEDSFRVPKKVSTFLRKGLLKDVHYIRLGLDVIHIVGCLPFGSVSNRSPVSFYLDKGIYVFYATRGNLVEIPQDRLNGINELPESANRYKACFVSSRRIEDIM